MVCRCLGSFDKDKHFTLVLTVAVDALIVYELPDKAVQPLMVILPLLTDEGRAV